MRIVRFKKGIIVRIAIGVIFAIILLVKLLIDDEKKFIEEKSGRQVFITNYKEIFETRKEMTRDYILDDVKKTIQKQIKIDKGTGCETPRLDPFNKDFIKAYVAMPPCKGITWVKCYMSECGLTRELMDTMYDIECFYRDIIFVNDHHYYISENETSLVGDDIYILQASDYVKVKCSAKYLGSMFNTHWSGYGYGIRRSAPSHRSPRGREGAPNVLILGIDSASHNEFLRQMPRTMRKLEELGAVMFNRYNIVGDGTPAALFPLLTGHTEPELPEARKGFRPKRYLEIFPWIFYRLTDDGYRTAYFEDRADVGTFQLRFHGWQKAPTDHYSRPLFMNYEYYNTKYWLIRPETRSMDNCFGAEYTHRVMLNLTDQFWHLGGKKFSLTFFVDLNHEEKSYLYDADKDFLEFLNNFADRGFTKNTMIIMMSDHGNRYSEYRQFLQGKLEERLPFLAIVLPEDLKRTRPTALSNLKSNVDVLTTPHDLHATILDVVGLSQYANPYKVEGSDLKRGISLLEKIPSSRSCSEAEVLPHWCTCLSWVKLPHEDPMRWKAADALLNAINEITLPIKRYCEKRTLDHIEWVMIAKPTKQLIDYVGPNLSEDFVKKSTGSPTDDYQVKIATSPGNGVFEGTLTYIKSKAKFTVSAKDISRITKYANEARCINSAMPHLSKFCFCIS